MAIKLKGHETFTIREGWLDKGLKAVSDNGKVFSENYGADAVTKNLYEVFKMTSAMISSEELAGAVSSAKSTMNSFNMIFANSKLAFYLTVVFFVLFVIIAM